ncbi:MAG TPA: hypothetical protein VJ553_06490, partial [Candidatus Paceibacterota bacterium]|nr:hypothetical protein [Candidatus Paceibacterota bacterium]
MVKKIVAAIFICAVMVLVAAAPLAMATHELIKGPQGPRASAMTWEYTPPGVGVWWGHVNNNGLRWLVIDVYDNTNGMMDEIAHQHLRFAAYNAYPSGEVDTVSVAMAADHIYSITAIPNGPLGSSCMIDDMFRLAVPPVAVANIVSQT